MDAEFAEFLDAISTCFIEADFDGWRSRVILPFTFVTRTGPIVLADEAALAANFDMYLVACSALRLDRVYRVPKELERCPDDTWLGTFETNLMRGAIRATAPYVSTALLHPENGRFRMSAMLNARGYSDFV